MNIDVYGVFEYFKNCLVYKNSVKYNVAPLYDILANKFPVIMESMLNDDFFIIQDKCYDFIFFIIVDDEVIGFTASNIHEPIFLVELCYIVEEYRSKGLFKQHLMVLNEYIDRVLCLYLPNRFAINSLIDNGLAEIEFSSIVRAKMLLSFTHPLHKDNLLYSYYYDLRLCGVIDLENEMISPILDVDLYCFNANIVREELLTVDYFRNVKKELGL